MTDGFPVSQALGTEIWVALADPAARLRLEQAAASIGYGARSVAPGELSEAPPACAALVSDLQPPGPSLDWLEHLRKHRQGIPVLLYLPVRTGVDAALNRAMRMGVDQLIFQRGKANERDRLVGALRAVLDNRTLGHVLDHLSASVPRSSMGFRVLKHYGIRMANEISPADHLDTVAEVLQVTPRTLQRTLHADGWPSPEEPLNWMLLLMSAIAGDVPGERTVRRRIQRVAARLLGIRGLENAPDLDVVTRAFTARVRGRD